MEITPVQTQQACDRNLPVSNRTYYPLSPFLAFPLVLGIEEESYMNSRLFRMAHQIHYWLRPKRGQSILSLFHL